MMMAITERKQPAEWALGKLAASATQPKAIGLGFQLPPHLEAAEPPEMRGLARDEVRLLVSRRADRRLMHARFRDLPEFLDPGDVVVINTSGTLPAALRAERSDGLPLELHLSTRLSANRWSVEIRRYDGNKSRRFYGAAAGDAIRLPGGATAELRSPYAGIFSQRASNNRLWVADLHLPLPTADYLAAFGFPIRYSYVSRAWPLEYYQTVFVTEQGSAEMPSAGRPFTSRLITKLVANGVQIAPLLLHTGVASLEEHERPYDEYYSVPESTAASVNAARAAGRRVVAIGTTVVRALETIADTSGKVHSGQGWTDLVVSPKRGLRVVDSLLTGFHEPRASHLLMLEALAGPERLSLAYQAALQGQYLWHEFGDVHLILA